MNQLLDLHRELSPRATSLNDVMDSLGLVNTCRDHTVVQGNEVVLFGDGPFNKGCDALLRDSLALQDLAHAVVLGRVFA